MKIGLMGLEIKDLFLVSSFLLMGCKKLRNFFYMLDVFFENKFKFILVVFEVFV